MIKKTNFDDKKINKNNLYKNKKLFKIDDIDTLLDIMTMMTLDHYV